MDHEVIETHIIPKIKDRLRASDYGGKHLLTTPSRKAFKKAIKAKRVLINSQLAYTSTYLNEGDLLEILEEKKRSTTYRIPLRIYYEDDHLAILWKPAGLLTTGNQLRTFTNALSSNVSVTKSDDALKNLHPVHRLDKDASGLLIVSKTRSAQTILYTLISKYKIEKTYKVITHGCLPNGGRVAFPLDGKNATTIFTKIKSIPSDKYGDFSVADIKIIEGRTHQIRRHMQMIGHPIVGDNLYPKANPGRGLYLCCYNMTLSHPITNERITVNADLPKKFDVFPN